MPNLDELIGLPLVEARELLEGQGFLVRVFDGEPEVLGLERMFNRINLVAKGGLVARAWEG